MITSIEFLSEGVDLPDFDKQRIARWISAVADRYGKIVGSLNYIFCNDDKILEVNKQFLNHDYYTDIITFDYSRGKLVSGDMFISLDTVATNAESVGQPYDRELMRVVIHGVLHLCGINDKGPGEREIMEGNENVALDMLETIE